MTVLTERFARAVDYARIAHADQKRKGTDIPYLTHLLSVASLVIEFGGSEDQAIAGLLHDTIEDCGADHEPIIRAEFGDVVADIVVACTDGTAEGKAAHADAKARKHDWIERKRAYLAHLAEAPDDVLLVSACDKLHNAGSVVRDLEDPDVGMRVFERFKGGTEGTLGNYRALSDIFLKRGVVAANPLRMMVDRMHAQSAGNQRGSE
jgi:(p)ppGpp synthase/HD superfamily hydrolase